MIVVNSLISTFQSSLQSVYGLFTGSVAVLNDLRSGRKIITFSSPSSPSSSVPEGDAVDSSSFQSNIETKEIPNGEKEVKVARTVKSRVVRLITDGLAAWHFLATLAHIIKRAVAVKIHIVKPDKIVLNQRRVINLSSKLHDTVFKHS